MPPVLALYEDVFSNAATLALPPMPRLIFLVHGGVTVADRALSDGEAWQGEGAATLAAGTYYYKVKAEDAVGKAVAKIVRAELVVIDDVGLLPVGADAAEGLYRIVEAAYERKSVAISSNLHPSGFDELMPKTLATATVDRLLHHAHLCQTSGDSVRLAQALHGKGVKPLT